MKRVAEHVLASAMRLPVLRDRMAGRVLILAYHNVIPPGHRPAGEHSAHIPWDRFVQHLDVISRVADVVPLSTLCEPQRQSAERARVVLTFDDAYAGAVEHGIPEASRRGLAVTLFVTPGFIGGEGFWWDRLANPDTGVLDPATRRFVLDTLGGRTDRAKQWASEQGLPWNELPPYACASSAHSLERCGSLPGVTIGGHTWSHANLLQIDRDGVDTEMHRCRAWEQQFDGSRIAAFAFPYGNWSRAIDLQVRDAGYHVTLLVNGGWCAPHPDTGQPLPRLNVPAGLSARGLELRLRGLLA